MDSCEYCDTQIDYHEVIECITCALDAKDPYTAGHSKRVSDMATKVCELIGLKKEDIQKIHIAAHLHDIGKIGVPDAVLNKEGKLTDEEWEYIRKHPQIGADILSKSHRLSELKNMVLCHHERYDGKGYPNGIKGKEIPILGRILAVCDSFDAMVSRRAYKEKLSVEYAIGELENGKGTQFDPDVAQAFIELVEEDPSFIKR